MGEQCNALNGGDTKGPDVWPLVNSFLIKLLTASLLCEADNKFFGLVIVKAPLNPRYIID